MRYAESANHRQRAETHIDLWNSHQRTHVFAKVLNLTDLSRASPSAVRVQRPPFAMRSGASVAASVLGSEPGEKFGCVVVLVVDDILMADGWRYDGLDNQGWCRDCDDCDGGVDLWLGPKIVRSEQVEKRRNCGRVVNVVGWRENPEMLSTRIALVMVFLTLNRLFLPVELEICTV